MDGVEFGVLGPVEVRVPGRPPVALPPAVRAVLARLAMSPGRVVSVDALTDALWGEDLPGDAANALQLRVSKLRRALAAAGAPADLLVTRAPGYRLAVEPDAVDAQRFERLLGGARRCAGTDAPGALALLDEALALWRGSAPSRTASSCSSSSAGTARPSPTSSGWRRCTPCASGCTGCS